MNMAVMMGRTVNNRRSHEEEVQGKEMQEEGQKLQYDEVNTMHS
jgi:hypothetical protein